jgi:hypothetical protein
MPNGIKREVSRMSFVMNFAKQRQQESRNAETPEGKQKLFFCLHDVIAADNDMSSQNMSSFSTSITDCVEAGGLIKTMMKAPCKYQTRLHHSYQYNDKPEKHIGLCKEPKEAMAKELVAIQEFVKQEQNQTKSFIPVEAIADKKISINITKEGISIVIG